MKIKWLSLDIWFFILLFLFQSNLYAKNDIGCGIKVKTPVYETKIGTNFNKYNFGFSLYTNKIFPKFPFQVKIGNLSAGGILSKMNQPLISGIGSPFSSGISSVSGLNVSLPGYSSFSNPVSSFFQIGYNYKKTFLQNVYLNCWYSPKKDALASSISSHFKIFHDKVHIKSAFCIGRFPYTENNSNSWILKEPYYKDGMHFVSCINNSIELWNFFLLFTLYLNETPIGTIHNMYKADFKYSGNHFFFTLSGAYNQKPFISSSDQTIKPCIQFRTALQYKETIRIKLPLFIKLGISAFGNIHQYETLHDLKTAIGIQARNSIFSLSVTGTLNSKINTENINYPIYNFESMNLKTGLSVYFPYITTSLLLGASFTPDNDFEHLSSKYSGKVEASYGGKIQIIPSSSYSISLKDYHIENQKINFDLSLQFKYSIISCSIKLSADMKI